ncbi:MAG: murein biosynthesis integral membrane protein MurJ [Caldimicrobium sp.]|nr:murein biosynthesis integral membrane protein MurJ [Caldimicrobium sp.]MCX7872984.1 murein biosynthesis integral membrane protein MurJ [Caldimicrobium sp.]
MEKIAQSKLERVTKGATSVTLAVFISRILGLVREQVLAYYFGAGKAMDAFVVGYRIPNLLRDLFAEGALAGAFTKVFTSSVEREGLNYAFYRGSIVLSNWLLILSMVVLLGIIFAPEIVSLIAKDFLKNPDKFELTVSLTRIMMPFLLFISISALFAGLLNSLGIFFWPALSSGFFNLASIIIGVLGYYLLIERGYEPILGMALGVALGGLFQALLQYPLLKKRGFKLVPKIDFSLPEFKEVLLLLIPVVIGFSAVQINIFINTYFATSCGEGAVSWYNYAFRVMYVPLGLFGVGLGQALLPELTRTLLQGNLPQARELYTKILVVSLSVSLPSALGLYLISEPLIKLLFERGSFKEIDTLKTAEILKILSVALPFYGLSKVSLPLFYAINRTSIPAIGSFLAVFSNLSIILVSIKIWEILGVAGGTAGSLILQALFLTYMSSQILGGLSWQDLIKPLFTLGLACLALFLIVQVFLSIIKTIWALPLVILLGALLFVSVCRFLGPQETYLFYKKLFPFL